MRSERLASGRRLRGRLDDTLEKTVSLELRYGGENARRCE